MNFKKDPKQKAISKARHKIYYKYRAKQWGFYLRQIIISAIVLAFAIIHLNNCYQTLDNVMRSPNITSKQIWAVQQSTLILLAMWIVACGAAFLFISHLDWSYDKHLKKLQNRLPESSWKTYRETAFKKADKLADKMLKEKQERIRLNMRRKEKAKEPYEKKIEKLKQEAQEKSTKKKKNKKK